MSDADGQKHNPHVALLPGAGMGHLTPFVRLAALLTANNVQVTFITPQPTVSIAESQALSRLFASFPQIDRRHFNLLPVDKLSTSSDDPFYYHFEVIRHSSHLLSPLLSSMSPPVSALITDMSLAFAVMPVTTALGLPNYILFTSSAKMLTLFASFHTIVGSIATTIKISNLEPIPKSRIPPPLLQEKDNLLKTLIIENGKKIAESNGILVNTVEGIEQKSLTALNDSSVIEGLPSVIAIGPLAPCHFEKNQQLAWLDDQPAGSVVYVSFGSRTAMSREQIGELGDGLVRSGCRFLWVVKDKKVDREDDEKLDQVIRHGLIEQAKGKGLVVKQWLNQEDILGHSAIGGFLSHCGWNSVIEAVWHGVPILAWPQHGDQKINADLVENMGLGIWEKGWGWGGEKVVKGTEIADKVRQLMGNELLRIQAVHIREEARTAVAAGGTSKKGLTRLIEMWQGFEAK